MQEMTENEPSSENESSLADENVDIQRLTVAPPQMRTAKINIVGFAPLMVQRFSAKKRAAMEAKMAEGARAQNRKNREPRDFSDDFEDAAYLSPDGWYGIHASAFRNAMISACKLCSIVMTRAKLTIFCEPDGFDATDSTPLVRIIAPPPEPNRMMARNATGVIDIRCRPLWRPGWQAIPTITWDNRQFGAADVFNLLSVAGLQVGIGEGRPDSKKSNGLGYGRFNIDPNVPMMVHGEGRT